MSAHTPQEMQAIVDASAEAWNLFVRTGLETSIYDQLRQVYLPREAGQICLLHLYLSTFDTAERQSMHRDSELFLHYASGFIKELLPTNHLNPEYRQYNQKVFCKVIRRIMRHNSYRQSQDAIEITEYILGALELTRSMNCMILTWDRYREFAHRHHPDLLYQSMLIA
ncbi:MAG: hypothetical protein KDK39_01525 [Leptospiraceae bacterium]|nr:hypothetical protein [Leptospiraceae bacterium]